MTPVQKQTCNHTILIQLEASAPFSLTAEAILMTSRAAYGLRKLTPDQLQNQLDYLEGKEMITRIQKPINKAVVEYVITDKAVEYLDEENLI